MNGAGMSIGPMPDHIKVATMVSPRHITFSLRIFWWPLNILAVRLNFRCTDKEFLAIGYKKSRIDTSIVINF
jgi:hypothetical protein